jgi:LuxR family quorum-sensing system transcriptional regulator CciR
MLYSHEYQSIIQAFYESKDNNEIQDVLEHLTYFLGFRHFAIGNHVDLLNPPPTAFGISNYTPDWLSEVFHEQYYMDDPIHFLCNGRHAGFTWPDPHLLKRLNERHRYILERGALRNFRAGYTVPVFYPGEFSGSCTFATPLSGDIPHEVLPAAFYAASHAFEAMRRLARMTAGLSIDPPPQITNRQRELVLLMGQGKTYAEMGMILGISGATAHQHCKTVFRSYGNIQRCNLIARVLFDGVASYPEMLRKQ